MLRHFAIGLVLALLMALPATAQYFQKAKDAGKRGDFATALKKFRPLAQQGHVRAQNGLGYM